MKIVCGSCGAKYSIADDKVQGKVFKIRCRKCSNVIVVKGNEDAQASEVPAPEAAVAAPQGGTQEWYVVIDSEQSGPLSADDVERYFIQGRITGESFIWRDGMADWSPLFSVDAFNHLNNTGYEEDDATMIAQSPLSSPVAAAGVAAGASLGGFGDFDDDAGDDATAIVDAEQFRQQHDAQIASATAGADAYSTSQPAAQHDPYAAPIGNDPFAATSGADPFGSASADPFGSASADPFGTESAGAGNFGSSPMSHESDPTIGSSDPFASNDLNAGFGGSSAGIASMDAAGGVDGGMFSGFDGGGGGLGNSGGFDTGASFGSDDNASLAYQSFAGLNSAGSASAAPAPSPSIGGSNNNNLIGERNENSVLFSLSSLQQVEAVKSGPVDHGNTEGSGLIDIQALASSHQQLNASRSGGGSPMPTPETFSPGTMSVPAIMPSRGSHRSNKALIIGVAVAVIALMAIGITVIVLMATREDKPQQVVVTEKIIERVVEAKPTIGDKERAKIEADAVAKAALAANAVKVEEKPKDDEPSTPSSKKKSTRRSSKSTPKPSTPAPKKPVSSKKKDGIDNLLAGIGSKKSPDKSTAKTPAAAAPSKANLPKKLTKPQVQSTFRKYSGRVKNCKNSGNLKGTLWVRLKIAESGKVSSAAVSSKSAKFKGTDVGRCAVGVVKSMRFPATQDSLSITYPLVL